MMRRQLLLIGLLVLVAACSGAGVAASPSTTPTPGPSLTLAGLKLALVHRLGPLWYCDPDFYPLQRGEEIDSALKRWGEVTADAEALAVIAADLGLGQNAAFTDAQKLAVYHTWKILNAIGLDPAGAAGYRFDYLAGPAAGAAGGTRSAGTISAAGVITVTQQASAGQPMCPICLARGTVIETPSGGRAVDTLRIGDPVWTLDPAGRRVAGTVIALGSTPAPTGHHVVWLVLADGRSVTASPGHPLADGRLIGELAPGDPVAGSLVIRADLVPYAGDATFDIVVSGGTGTYLVDGIALGSTLQP